MKKIGLKKESEMIRRLYYLLSSGQGIIESFSILQRSHPFISPILVSVKSGKSLGTSMNEMKTAFSPITLKIIEVGELTGTLSASLLHLSEHLRRSYEMKSRLINACIYPLIIFIMSIGLISLLVLYIFPKILPVFEGMNIKLPITTRFLIFITDFLSSRRVLIAGSIFATVVFCLIVFAKKFRSLIKKIFHLRSIFLISFFRSMGMMLQSQIGILQALYLTGESENNPYYKALISGMTEHVKTGKTMSSFLSENRKSFTEISFQFISIGERTGSLGKACIHFSEYLEHDHIQALDRLLFVVEPAIMIFIGAVVGFVALSLISPLYEMSRITAF